MAHVALQFYSVMGPVFSCMMTSLRMGCKLDLLNCLSSWAISFLRARTIPYLISHLQYVAQAYTADARGMIVEKFLLSFLLPFLSTLLFPFLLQIPRREIKMIHLA